MWNQGGYTETSSIGGYTQSPGGFASPALSQGAEKKGRTRANQIVPCTVSQLMSASQGDESFRVGEVDVSQVTIVGIIRSQDKSMTNIQYKVDDMTAAPMDVKQWVDTEDPGMDNSSLPPGTYVKVSGNLRSFQNHRSLVAFSVRPLEDMNEITSHMLEVVQAHMVLSKPTTMPSAAPGMASVMTTPMSSTKMAGAYPGANEMMMNNASLINNGLSAHQNQVLGLIRGCPDPKGISIQDLKQRLSGMSVTIIKQSVEFLSNEGHIFSTIDEDHFKSTDNDD
ncbi:replication protein A 32 kDa subunit [Gouania willdenowi]|uniref:Replication factor A protein 2 n=1 Tax=Gouania willdenowi TaxID=441366 RepID=A0A8C5G740_GOUWI|nr:replication protein A 32 kDa subunit [Gouania willdenowi]